MFIILMLTFREDALEGEMLRNQRSASVNNRSWQSLIPSKRGYPEVFYYYYYFVSHMCTTL